MEKITISLLLVKLKQSKKEDQNKIHVPIHIPRIAITEATTSRTVTTRIMIIITSIILKRNGWKPKKTRDNNNDNQ